jgi:hypothetical protein
MGVVVESHSTARSIACSLASLFVPFGSRVERFFVNIKELAVGHVEGLLAS